MRCKRSLAVALTIALGALSCGRKQSSNDRLVESSRSVKGFPREGMLVVDVSPVRVSEADIDALNETMQTSTAVDAASVKTARSSLSVSFTALDPVTAADNTTHPPSSAPWNERPVYWRAQKGCAGTKSCSTVVFIAQPGTLTPGASYLLSISAEETESVTAASLNDITIEVDDSPDGLQIPNLKSFQADAFSGNASAGLDFDVPAGPAGLGPSIGVSYSSLRGAKEKPSQSDESKTQINHRKRVGVVGRGWDFSGLSYIAGNKHKRLVLGGRTYKLQRDHRRTKRFSKLRVTWHGDAAATVEDGHGMRYEFGGFVFDEDGERIEPKPRGTAFRAQYRCAEQRHGNCTEDSLKTVMPRMAHWARNRLLALNQWVQWVWKPKFPPAGTPVDELWKWWNKGEWHTHRMFLRKQCDRFNNCINFFYGGSARHNPWVPQGIDIRPSRIVWATGGAITEVDNQLRQLARDAYVDSGKGTSVEHDTWYKVSDCHTLDDWHRVRGDVDEMPFSPFGGTAICGDGADWDTYPQTIIERLNAIDAAIDALPRMELSFHYQNRQDGVSEAYKYGKEVYYEVFTGRRLASVEFSARKPAWDAARVIRGWSFMRDGDGGDGDELKNRHSNLSSITAWTASAANSLPPLSFTYYPSSKDHTDRERSLLASVHNGYGGEVHYTYNHSEDVERGVVSQIDAKDGQNNSKRREYLRTHGLAEAEIDDDWGGSRVVQERVFQTTVGKAEKLEHCIETRYFTNREDIAESEAGYTFADGVVVSDAVSGTNQVDDNTIDGLAGSAYQQVTWKPSQGVCPALASFNQASSVQPAWSDHRTFYQVVANPTDPETQELLAETQTKVARTLARTLIASPAGLAAASRQVTTTKEYDTYLNPTKSIVYRSVNISDDSKENETNTTYFPIDRTAYLIGLIDQTTIAGRGIGGSWQQKLSHRSVTYKSDGPLGATAAVATTTIQIDPDSGPIDGLCAATPPITTTYNYDEYGNLKDETTGNRTINKQYDRDFHAFSVKVTNALGHSVTQTYDDFLRPETSIGPYLSDAKGQAPRSTQHYDTRGRPAGITVATGQRSTIAYVPPAGDETRWKIENCAIEGARCTQKWLDGWGNVVEAITSQPGKKSLITTKFTYDGFGREVSRSLPFTTGESEPTGKTVTHYMGRNVIKVSPSGVYTQTCMTAAEASGDPNNPNAVSVLPNLVESRSGSGQWTRCDAIYSGRKVQRRIDELGRTSSVIEFDDDATPRETHYVYDGQGKLIETTDAIGRTRRIQRNLRGEEIVRSDPDSGRTVTCHNQYGDLVLKSSAETRLQGSSAAIHTDYDALGRPTRMSIPDSVEPITQVFTYDDLSRGEDQGALGRRTHIAISSPSFRASQSKTYDRFGRTVTTQQSIALGTQIVRDDLTTNVSYDQATGDVLCRDYPNGKAIVSKYDLGSGQMLAIDAKDCRCHQSCDNKSKAIIDATAFSAGRRWWVHYGDTSEVIRNFDNKVTGRLNGTRVNTTDPVDHARTTLAVVNYHYDPSYGDLSRRDRMKVDGSDEIDQSTSYTYDSRGRLSTASAPGFNRSYSYDAIGNITSFGSVDDTYAYSEDSVKRLLSGKSNGREWTLNYTVGETTTGKIRSKKFSDDRSGYLLRYDGLGRVSELRVLGAGGRITKRVRRYYGAQGLALVTIRQLGQTGQQTTIYGPGGWEESSAAEPNSQRVHIRGPVGSILVSAEPGKNFEIEQINHSDHLGSPIAITGTLGQPLKPEFAPFGKGRNADAEKAIFGFTGHRQDQSLPLIDANARYYDPDIGRFVSDDPVIADIHNAQSFNAYSYVNNSPTHFADPSGLCPSPPCGRAEPAWSLGSIWKGTTSFLWGLGDRILTGAANFRHWRNPELYPQVPTDHQANALAYQSLFGHSISEGAYNAGVDLGGWAPGVGDAEDLQAFEEARRSGNMLMTGAHGAGMLAPGRSTPIIAGILGVVFEPESLKPGDRLPEDEIVTIVGTNAERPGAFVLREGIDDQPIGPVTTPGRSAGIASTLDVMDEVPRAYGREAVVGDSVSAASVRDIEAAGFFAVLAPTEDRPDHVRIIPGERTFDEEGRKWLSGAFDLLERIGKKGKKIFR